MSAESPQPAGAYDSGALQKSIREAAQRAQDLQRQVDAARTSLTEAAAKVAELEQQAASAQQAIVHYGEQEQAVTRALQDAHRTSEELLKSAKARSEETIAAAKVAAEGIVHAARATATETLQKARESAQEQIQAAEHATATAKAAADEITQTARAAAAETLERARESAQEHLRTAERQAAEHLARLRAESDELVEETNRKVQEVRQAAEHHVTAITAKLDAFIRDREEISRGLDALARNHAESLQTMARLRSEVQGQILPAVHRLLKRLRGEDAGSAEEIPARPTSSGDPEATAAQDADTGHRSTHGTAVAEPRPESEAAAVEDRTQVPGEPAREAASVAAGPEHDTASEAVPDPQEPAAAAVRYIGQIVVSPIHSFLQATKFMTALSQVKGVASVKLRTYSGAKATIEVVTVGHTVADINFRAISGFSIEVVESTDTHLALKLSSSAARTVPG
jgi:hypothetical protein